MSNDGKLYVKAKCSVCMGKHRHCFYCDSLGEHYIEAADTIVIDWLRTLSEERKKKIIDFASGDS